MDKQRKGGDYSMREWHKLMKYIDSYRYDRKKEEITIKKDENEELAREVYWKCLSDIADIDRLNDKKEEFAKLDIDKLDEDVGLLFEAEYKYSDFNDKWEFDIALDCIRRMKRADREYITKHLNQTNYHFGYALYIRNHYIHVAKKHIHYEADDISGGVMSNIFSILSPVYAHSEIAIWYFESFEVSLLTDRIRDNHEEVFLEVEEGLLLDRYASFQEAINDLECRLQEKIGTEELNRILKKNNT